MPSLQSHFFRLITKYFVAPMFKRRSIPEWRIKIEQSAKYLKIPADTEIWPILVNGVAAEWVRAPNARTDAAILYLHGGVLMVNPISLAPKWIR